MIEVIKMWSIDLFVLSYACILRHLSGSQFASDFIFFKKNSFIESVRDATKPFRHFFSIRFSIWRVSSLKDDLHFIILAHSSMLSTRFSKSTWVWIDLRFVILRYFFHTIINLSTIDSFILYSFIIIKSFCRPAYAVCWVDHSTSMNRRSQNWIEKLWK